ncbi:MAG: CdaR family protein [candidate division KSB1 bacterium]|nr:CdaR family protein [candidate division KSB1 bacterium]
MVAPRALLRRYRIAGVVLVLALVLWLYVKTENYYDWVFDVPLRVVGITPGLTLGNDPPLSVRVRVRGQGRALIAISISRDFAVTVNANLGRGTHRIPLGVTDVTMADYGGRIEVLEVLSPKEALLVLEPRVERTIPVQPKVAVQPLNGYAVVGAVHVEPESVSVAGPESLVRTVERWATKSRQFARATRDVRVRVPLEEPVDQKLTVNRREVLVVADVQKLMERVMHDIPVQARNIPPGYRAFVVPPKLTLTIEGGVDVVTKVSAEQITAYVEWRLPASPEQVDFPAVIETPEGVSWRDVSPQRFKVVLER